MRIQHCLLYYSITFSFQVISNMIEYCIHEIQNEFHQLKLKSIVMETLKTVRLLFFTAKV